MIFRIVSILIPILLLTLLPWVINTYTRHTATRQPALIVAAILFFISWYIPSPLIDGQQTQFLTHFIGGGLFTGLLWLYLKQTLQWRPRSILLEAFSLYALVSALGVANELFELTIKKLSIVNMNLNDTPWDLVANTLGALAFYFVYRIIRAVAARK